MLASGLGRFHGFIQATGPLPGVHWCFRLRQAGSLKLTPFSIEASSIQKLIMMYGTRGCFWGNFRLTPALNFQKKEMEYSAVTSFCPKHKGKFGCLLGISRELGPVIFCWDKISPNFDLKSMIKLCQQFFIQKITQILEI
jgi:hypothetical protein